MTLTIGATGNGTATSITFGDGTGGTVKSLNDLNTALAANNLQATVNSTGVISITTTSDAASSTIGAIGGTAAGSGNAFNGLAAAAPVKDPVAQQLRANLVTQYNNIMDQITTTAQDASFNGINLLNGDQLKLTFNETGKSTLKIQGVTFNAAGLGLVVADRGHRFPRQYLGQCHDRQAQLRCEHVADRRPLRSVRTCRSCRSVRTSPRT